MHVACSSEPSLTNTKRTVSRRVERSVPDIQARRTSHSRANLSLSLMVCVDGNCSLHLRGGLRLRLTGHQYQEVGEGGDGLVGGAGSTAVRVGGASTASGGHAKCSSSRGG